MRSFVQQTLSHTPPPPTTAGQFDVPVQLSSCHALPSFRVGVCVSACTDGDPSQGRLVKLVSAKGLQGQRDESDDGWPSGCFEDSSAECRLPRESNPRPRGLHPAQSDDARSTIAFAGLLGSMEPEVSAIDPKTF